MYNSRKYTYPDSHTVLIDLYWPNGKLTKSKHLLNENGKDIKVYREYIGHNKTNSWSETTYTYYSNIISIYSTGNDSECGSYISNIDSTKNEIEIIKISNYINWRLTKKFDENFFLILEESTLRDGKTTNKNYYYEFDYYGNWISRITRINNKSKYITTREILYY